MSYSANVYNVMIASPGDVLEERNIIREVIYRWNAVNSRAANIVLLPIGWETHSSPEMGASPQDIINFQVLENSDILIGVFWTRLGTPTKGFNSGTVEEIEKHITLDKPTMLYFSDKPITPSSIDREQYTRLMDFKKSCFNRGLCSTYNDINKFRELFYDHLQLLVNRMQPTATTQFSSGASLQKIDKITIGEVVLLKSATLDPSGEIRITDFEGGSMINTYNLQYIDVDDKRKFAKMETALKGLLSKELIDRVGASGKIFKVNGHGYDFAERVQESDFNNFIKLIEANEF